MKLIQSSYEIIDIQPRDIAIPDNMEIGPKRIKEELLNTVYRQIEAAGRTCYKSEDKITETSAKEFVERMINSGHHAMLEFGTVYLKQGVEGIMNQINSLSDKYNNNKYSKVVVRVNDNPGTTLLNGNFFFHTAYITTNLRVLVENGWLDDLKYICEPTEYHEKRICVKFTVDRGISHELVRHRVFSFAQESTRYCNYSKDKFGNELTFILPSWNYIKSGDSNGVSVYDGDFFEKALNEAEVYYLKLLKLGWTPQQARQVLPNALKTEINMCGFISDWEHVFELRDNSHAHPDMQVLMKPLHEEFKKKFKIK